MQSKVQSKSPVEKSSRKFVDSGVRAANSADPTVDRDSSLPESLLEDPGLGSRDLGSEQKRPALDTSNTRLEHLRHPPRSLLSAPVTGGPRWKSTLEVQRSRWDRDATRRKTERPPDATRQNCARALQTPNASLREPLVGSRERSVAQSSRVLSNRPAGLEVTLSLEVAVTPP